MGGWVKKGLNLDLNYDEKDCFSFVGDSFHIEHIFSYSVNKTHISFEVIKLLLSSKGHIS